MRALHANRHARLDGSEEGSFIDERSSLGRLDDNWPMQLRQGNARGTGQFTAALAHLFQRVQHQIERGRKFSGHVPTI
jgi:hypothetical protein